MSYNPQGYPPPDPHGQQPAPLPQTRRFDAYQPQPSAPPYVPAGYGPPPKKPNVLKVVLIAVAAVLVVCVGFPVMSALLTDSKAADKAEAEAVAAATTAAPTPTVTARHSPAALSPVEEPAQVKMPDVRGQNAAVAEQYLRDIGFTQIKFGSQDELDSWVVLPENWTVKKQSTKAGRTIPSDTLIVLTCTKTG